MKLNRLSMLAAVGATFIASSANAVFTGLTLELHTTTTPEQTEGISRDVYRLYANFSQQEALTGIFGNALGPFTINLNGNTPYNPSFGGNLPLNSEQLPQHPSAAFDCYMTIGAEAGYSSYYHMVISPGFPNFVTAAGIFNHTNIAIAAPGQPPINYPDANGRILVMQITVNAGGPAPSGVLSVNYLLNNMFVTQVFNQSWSIPGPGAWAFLATVVVIGSRRRKA